MTMATATAHTGALVGILGGKHVCDDPQALQNYAIDGVTPVLAVHPGSAEEVAAILRFCSEHGLVVVPAGAFTQQQAGRPPQHVDVVLQLERLNSVEHYDPGDLTVGVGAGRTLGDLSKLVGAQRQMFPCDPPNADAVTIGGAMATAIHGPLKHSFGGLRDFCIGVKFATPDGKLAKAGGRVVKNVAGFDLMKLLIGSFGTLGVIVSANFKVFPAPPQTSAYVCEFVTLQKAIAFRDHVLNSPLAPMCLEIISPGCLDSSEWCVAVRAGGSERVLARCRAELGHAVTRELSYDAEAQFWRALSEFVVRIQSQYASGAVLDVNLAPAAVEAAISSALLLAAEAGLKFWVTGRVAIGSLAIVFAGEQQDALTRLAKTIERFRRILPSDAAAVVLDCTPELKRSVDVWGSTPTDLAAMRAIKQALDPNDILNRGRFLI